MITTKGPSGGSGAVNHKPVRVRDSTSLNAGEHLRDPLASAKPVLLVDQGTKIKLCAAVAARAVLPPPAAAAAPRTEAGVVQGDGAAHRGQPPGVGDRHGAVADEVQVESCGGHVASGRPFLSRGP